MKIRTLTQRSIPVSVSFLTITRIVFIAYAAAVICGIIHHEMADDEAQAWLLVRDNSLPELLKTLPFEGHPPLWYLIIFPFAKLSFPFETIQIISGLVSISAVYILLFRTQLPYLLKFLIPFSYFFFYEYSCIARNYCLLLFFIAAIISLYHQRFEKPWLFCFCVVGLFNSHVLIFAFGAGVLLLYIIDAILLKKINPKIMDCALTMTIGGFYLLPYMVTNKMTSFFESKITDRITLLYKTLTTGLLMDANQYLGSIVFILLVFLLIRKGRPLLLLLTGLSGALYILLFRYPGVIRHDGVLFLIITGTFGIAPFYYKNDSKQGKLLQYGFYLLCLIILAQLPFTLKSYKNDIDNLYSGSKDAAEFIVDNELNSKIIIGHQAISALAVLPYLPGRKQFYYSECERFGSYYIFDSCFTKDMMNYSVDYGVKVAHDNFYGQLDKIIFLFNYPVQPFTLKYLDLLYSTREDPIRREDKYFIYKFKPIVR